MSRLPRLELAEPNSPFDEAVIIVDGHEEETITIACPGSLALARWLITLVDLARAISVIEVPNFLKSEVQP
jgi:hypothetical protein